MEPAAPRWAADSKAARLTIPYLGPVPSPSLPFGVALMVAAVISAVVQLAKAVLSFRQAALEQAFVDGPSKARQAEAVAGAHLLRTVGAAATWVSVAVLVLLILWLSKRRPKAMRMERGEAYVEFPVLWVTPVAILAFWLALLALGLALGLAGGTTNQTPISELPGARQMLGLGGLTSAVYSGLLVGWIIVLRRAHEQRVAWSAPYRADPAGVPYFPPVTGNGYFGSGVVGSGARSTASGPGWFFSTAGLIVLVFVAIPAVIGGVAELDYGHATGLLWLLGGVGALVFVTWVMVRRYQQGRL